ncbi:unnamed protein product, partial [Polarella glacialis]
AAEGLEDGREGAAEIKPREDETPKLLLPTGSGFCVLCMADMDRSMAPPEDSVEVAGEDGGDGGEAGMSQLVGEERSWLVFFDQVNLIKRLFPPLAERASKAGKAANVAQMFHALSKEELAKLQPQEDLSTMEKAVALSKKLPPPDPNAIRAAKLAAEAARLALASTRKGRRLQMEAPDIMIAKLTADNLRKYDAAQKVQAQMDGTATKKAGPGVSSSIGSAAFGKSSDNTAARLAKLQGILPHAVPKNWQVAIKKDLKEEVAGKETRQNRMRKRMEQLRRE